MRDKITAQRLRERLDYDPETGVFVWKQASDRPREWNMRWVGKVAGVKARNYTSSYLLISIDGEKYLAHRLAWLYMTGIWPKAFIDHVNRDSFDNRWSNLREATKAQNGWNRRGADRDGSSGFRGVYRVKVKKKWKWAAKFVKEGKQIHCGYFLDKRDAAEAARHGRLRSFGQFAGA